MSTVTNQRVRTVKRLRKEGCDIRYSHVYAIVKANDPVTKSPGRSKQRKWVRYEHVYSNAMWHTDWHAIKDQRTKEMNLITYLDDASRRVTGAAPFREATYENAVIVLRRAISLFGAPATILSDNGSYFVGRSGRKKRTGSWSPTVFESKLLNSNIWLINSRPYHPQTNRKLERFHQSLENEIWHFGRLHRILQHRSPALFTRD